MKKIFIALLLRMFPSKQEAVLTKAIETFTKKIKLIGQIDLAIVSGNPASILISFNGANYLPYSANEIAKMIIDKLIKHTFEEIYFVRSLFSNNLGETTKISIEAADRGKNYDSRIVTTAIVLRVYDAIGLCLSEKELDSV